MTSVSSGERAFRAALYEVDGIGPQRFKVLLSFFGSAEKVWKAEIGKIQKTGLAKDAVEELKRRRSETDPLNHLKALARLGIRVVLIEDEEYPVLLREIANPPQVLFVRGRFQKEDRRALAVVGTRKPTAYGREVAERLVEQLVVNGFCIVSGLARGIDGIAHRAALDARGRTIAVLGGGVDRIYPPEHTGLADEVAHHGALISEFASGKLPVPGNFPARNRIISGLSLGVLVVEGASKSGTKITASLAVEQGREVFAVPGPITSRQSQATSDLIKSGAKTVTSIADILEELKPFLGDKVEGQPDTENRIDLKTLSEDEREVVMILEDGQLHVDEIVRKMGKPTSEVSALLTILELRGMVKHMGGMVYVLSGKMT